MVAPAEAAYDSGALVTLMWHSCRPQVGVAGPRSCATDPASGTPSEKLTAQEWAELLRDGSELNTAWKADLDRVADALGVLRDAGVAVLWRPLHEMNDSWAWWGGHGADSAELYDLMHAYFDSKGLTNLVWVWNVKDTDASAFAQYLPASADVLSLDVWMKDEPGAAEYSTLLQLAAGRPIALGEVKKAPAPALLASQPKWSWFMLWPDTLDQGSSVNSPAVLTATYGSPLVVDLARLRRAPDPVDRTDLALGRPVWSGTRESSYLDARWVVDGDSRTRWSSDYTPEQWIYVQLAEPAVVREVRLDWEAAYAKKFQVQVSADGSTWRTVAEALGTPGIQTVGLTGTEPVRYVKVYAWEKATAYGYSLWSLNVYS